MLQGREGPHRGLVRGNSVLGSIPISFNLDGVEFGSKEILLLWQL